MKTGLTTQKCPTSLGLVPRIARIGAPHRRNQWPTSSEYALKAGEKGRLAYYQERVVRFRGDQIRCLARSIADVPQGKPAEYKDILSSLKKEYGRSTAEKLFQRFERKGILEESGAGYAVPIPSMHTWLKEEYANK